MPQYALTTAETVAEARRALEEERAFLASQGIRGTLSLTGGSSLEGLVTKGDIDLHLRVGSPDFAPAQARLVPRYQPAHPEIWTDSFAAFERGTEPPIGLALTIVGSEHDRRFVRSWERMATDAAARAAYNDLKRRGGDVESAKSAFFDSLAGS